jgi:hypothetical protein
MLDGILVLFSGLALLNSFCGQYVMRGLELPSGITRKQAKPYIDIWRRRKHSIRRFNAAAAFGWLCFTILSVYATHMKWLFVPRSADAELFMNDADQDAAVLARVRIVHLAEIAERLVLSMGTAFMAIGFAHMYWRNFRLNLGIIISATFICTYIAYISVRTQTVWFMFIVHYPCVAALLITSLMHLGVHKSGAIALICMTIMLIFQFEIAVNFRTFSIAGASAAHLLFLSRMVMLVSFAAAANCDAAEIGIFPRIYYDPLDDGHHDHSSSCSGSSSSSSSSTSTQRQTQSKKHR